MKEQLDLRFNDGGRSKYFKANNVGDCVTRAIAIATNSDYKDVYNELKKISGESPRNGVLKKHTRKYMQIHGYKWVPTMSIGSGVQVHLRKGELPMDKRLICQLSGHLVAVVNGVVYDTFDSRREGTRAVYGYWIVK